MYFSQQHGIRPSNLYIYAICYSKEILKQLNQLNEKEENQEKKKKRRCEIDEYIQCLD